jgi:hypothetical protein
MRLTKAVGLSNGLGGAALTFALKPGNRGEMTQFRRLMIRTSASLLVRVGADLQFFMQGLLIK